MSENIEIAIVDEVSKNDYILLTNFAETNQQELSTNFPAISLPTVSESFSLNGIKTDDNSALLICAYDQRALLYAVYETLEKLGCRFYLSEEFIPKIEGFLEFDKINVSIAPLTGERIVFNWHNFLSGITS